MTYQLRYDPKPCPICEKVEPPIRFDDDSSIVFHVSDNVLEVRQWAAGGTGATRVLSRWPCPEGAHIGCAIYAAEAPL